MVLPIVEGKKKSYVVTDDEMEVKFNIEFLLSPIRTLVFQRLKNGLQVVSMLSSWTTRALKFWYAVTDEKKEINSI